MPIFSGGYDELPTLGTLSYNGVVFDALHTSQVSQKVVLTDDGRSAKWFEITISVSATITPVGAEKTINPLMTKLRSLLEQPRGVLEYIDKGYGTLVVNAPGSLTDCDFGPKPELLDFQPVGNIAAQVQWKITTRIPAYRAVQSFPVLQMTWERSLSYDDTGYTRLAVSGVLEIPLTTRTIGTQTIPQTVDNYRDTYLARITQQYDLERFRIVRRDFNISADKRKMTFDFEWQEQPPMSNPENILKATGNIETANKESAGGSLTIWFCTLRCSYVVPKSKPRRLAYLAFLHFLHYRMRFSANAETPATPLWQVLPSLRNLFNPPQQISEADRRPVLMSFRMNEGLYEDSFSVDFTARWRFASSFRAILESSGWQQLDNQGGATPGMSNPKRWAKSVQSICGPNSWLVNLLDPASCAIIDYGTSS